jgi:hypothetical protein
MTGADVADLPAQVPASTLVVLVVSGQGQHNPDAGLLRDTVHRAGHPVRMLMLVTDDTGLALAEGLAATQVELQLLLGPDVSNPDPARNFARMPHETRPNDQLDFALALADVVIADPARHDDPLVHRARALGKRLVAPGHGLPGLPPINNVAEGLDPVALPSHGWRRHWAGRLEQTLVELLGLLGAQPDPLGERCRRLWKCLWPRFDGSWCPTSYFAPDACRAFAQDPRGFDPASPLVSRFEALDRSAVFGAFVYRDLAWLVHFGAAAAVLAAVAGAILLLGHWSPPWEAACAVVEFLLLTTVAVLLRCVRRGRLQDRWTACRLGAEQLRIARMCLPLLVLPRALISRDSWQDGPQHDGDAPALTRNVLSDVKRAIRDHGLPNLNGNGSPEQAARWVACIVQDQMTYHRRNHQRLERAEHSLRIIAGTIFFAAILAVVVEFLHLVWHRVPDLPSLFLLTAAGPAFAAAFHGAATRLAIVHRIDLSQNLMRELQPVHDALTELVHRPALTALSWPEIRQRTFQAADAMGRENQSWLGLVRLQRDTLPA